jgi:hypothetical protein
MTTDRYSIPVDTIIAVLTTMAVLGIFFHPHVHNCILTDAHRSYTATVQIIVSPGIQILLRYPLGYRNLTTDMENFTKISKTTRIQKSRAKHAAR